jgi:hypothetical protein
MTNDTNNVNSQETQKDNSIWKKIFLGISILFFLIFLIASLGSWMQFFVILILWGLFVWFFVRVFVFYGKYSFLWAIIFFVIVTIVSVWIVPNDDVGNTNSDTNSSSTVSSKEAQQYDGKIYNIASTDGKVKGKAKIEIVNTVKPFMVTYSLHIVDNYPANKKCFTGTDMECRWIDYYNYAGDLFSSDSEGSYGAQLYPVFCSGPTPITDPEQDVMGQYIDCWSGKGNGEQKETNIFYFTMKKTFENIDEFLSYNTLKVFDAQPYTMREYKFENNTGTSTEQMDTESAVKSGKEVKSYPLEIVE